MCGQGVEKRSNAECVLKVCGEGGPFFFVEIHFLLLSCTLLLSSRYLYIFLFRVQNVEQNKTGRDAISVCGVSPDANIILKSYNT